MKLVRPEKKYREKLQEFFVNFQGEKLYLHNENLDDEKEFNKWLEEIEKFAKGEDLPKFYVRADVYLMVDEEDNLIGIIALRHDLTENLKKFGGNIGYGINTKYRKKGHGTQMLNFCLEEAKKIGLKEVLLTCNDKNLGSIGVIENNKGKLKDKIENNIDGEKFLTRRYLIEL